MADTRIQKRQRFADYLKGLRRKGMSKNAMIGVAGDILDMDRAPEPFSFKGFEESDFPTSEERTDYITSLYRGEKDSPLEQKIFKRRKDQRTMRLGRQERREARISKFARDKTAREEANMTPFESEPDTPGLERYDKMQESAFGSNTALKGSVATGLGQPTRRTLYKKEKGGPGILTQEQRMRLQKQKKESALKEKELQKLQAIKAETARLNADQGLRDAKAAAAAD